MTMKTLRFLALGALACAAAHAPARAEGWFKEMDQNKLVAFADVLKEPREYVDVPVKLHVYFQRPAKNFNPYFTRFIEELWGNFAAWPIDAKLYQKRDWERPFPFFFVAKSSKVWGQVQDVRRVTAIELDAVVRDVFRGQPWIEVTGYRTIGEGLTEDDVRDVARGDALFHAGKYRDAARSYERGMSGDHCAEVRADIYRRAGDAYFHAGQFQDARSSYRAGLRLAPDSDVLQRGVDASEQAYAVQQARSRGKPAPDVTVVPAPFHEPATTAPNSVDLLIAMFEDPAEVAAQQQAAVEELMGRSEAARAAAAMPEPVPAEEPTPVEEPAADAPAPVEAAPAQEPAPAESAAPEAEAPAQPEEPTADAPAADEAMEEGHGEEGVVPQDANAAGTGQEQPEEPDAAEQAPEAPAEASAETHEVAEGMEESAEGVEEGNVDGAAGGEGDASAGDAPAAATPEAAEEGATPEGEGVMEGEESAGGTEATEVVDAPATEPTVEDAAEEDLGDPRVVNVGGQRMRLPRLPFYGCDEVTVDELRAIFEEMLSNPEL